jgi:hypothetical protein
MLIIRRNRRISRYYLTNSRSYERLETGMEGDLNWYPEALR